MAKSPISTDIRLHGTNDPTFVIKCDGIYYVTQSVAVYDPAKAQTEAQRENIKMVEHLFNSAQECDCKCVKLPQENNIASFQQTD